jgi:hypothetical protein
VIEIVATPFDALEGCDEELLLLDEPEVREDELFDEEDEFEFELLFVPLLLTIVFDSVTTNPEDELVLDSVENLTLSPLTILLP